MEKQILFSGKNKKNISECCLLKFLPSMLSFMLHKMVHQTWQSDRVQKVIFHDVNFLYFCLF